MNHRRKAVLFTFFVLGAVGVAWIILRPREPVYQTRPLSAWLERLHEDEPGHEHEGSVLCG